MVGMSLKREATRLENELANILWERGFAVVRGPSSGSAARRRFQPDLIAAKDGTILIIEVKKAREGRPLYVPPHQVEGLRELERRSGGRAVVAVKIPWYGWRFHLLDGLHETRGGRLRIDRPESGMKLVEIEEIILGRSKRIDEYLGDSRTV
jgi:Holliday junction resolvase